MSADPGFWDALLRHEGPALLGAEPWDYAALRARITPLAYEMSGLTRVAVVGENTPDMVIALLAALVAGVTVVPINARLTPTEVAAIVTDAAPQAVFERGTLRRNNPKDPPPMPRDTAAILYTSGTTGRPKGVMIGQDAIQRAILTSATARGLTREDVLLAALPFSHVFGLVSLLLAGIYAGAKLWLLPRFDAHAAIDAIGQGVTIFPAVPRMHARILEAAPMVWPNRLRHVSSGAAPLSPDLRDRASAVYGCPLQNGYGLSETTAGVTLTQSAGDGGVGRPLAGVTLRLSEGTTGEIEVQSPMVMQGYFRDPAATAQAFTPDGFLRTGDLGHLDQAGCLHLIGRQKDTINHCGFKIQPVEIEDALLSHPDVKDAAAFGVPDPTRGEQVIAAVILTPKADLAGIAAHIADRLAPYKRPHLWPCQAIPAGLSGKVLRGQLRTDYLEHQTRLSETDL